MSAQSWTSVNGLLVIGARCWLPYSLIDGHLLRAFSFFYLCSILWRSLAVLLFRDNLPAHCGRRFC